MPRSDRSLGASPADRRNWQAACDIIHRHSRAARRACSARRVTDIPSGQRRWDSEANAEAAGRARVPGTHAWVYDRRIKQLARMEGDWAARTTALGTADVAKRVNRQEYCLTQPRATISMSRTTGRPTAEESADTPPSCFFLTMGLKGARKVPVFSSRCRRLHRFGS